MRLAALLALGLVLAAFVPAMAAQAQTPSPDLAVTHVGWDQLVEGDDTTFNATIRNDGDAAYDEDFDVRFHLEDDGFDETVTVQLEEAIAAGEERNVSADTPWEADIGTYTINATVEEEEGGLPGFGDDLEANDHRNRTFAIGPDIVTNQVRLEPSSPIAEQSVTFFAEIENDASDDHDVTEPFIVSFEVRDGDTTVATIESLPLDELRAKDPQQVTARTDWDAEAGSYTVVARADPDGNITEADEANNEAERAFSVKAAVPDLAVTDVAPADPAVATGETSPIEATIENRGTADVTEDFPVRFRVNGTTHGPDVHVQVGEGLKPGGEVTVESEAWLASEGHHELVAIADPGNNNVTDETKLANNERTRDLHVGPDLVVDDILWTPDPPAAGHEVTIEPIVRNQGTADVTQQTTLELRLPDQDESWTVEVAPLGAGNATQLEAATWTPPEDGTGDYPYEVAVEAETDVDDEASEIDDDNNQAQDTMTVTEPRPDLVTEAVELDPGSPAVGEETQIEATIRNAGSAEAGEVEVTFFVDEEPHGGTRTIASGQFETLGAGEQATVTSDAWEPTRGEHTITVHPSLADGGEEVREDNNNGTLEPLIGPDALVEDVAWTPEDPEAEDEVSFEVSVANAGSETIDELDLAVEVDGETVGERTLEDLATDTNRTVTVTWNATEGDHTVRAIVDPDDAIAEARETNNQREESFSTTASPDLQPTSIRWSEDPEPGDKLVFTTTIANTGTAPVEGSFTVSFHVGDEAVGTATLEGLEEGSSKSVSSDAWTAEAGTHTVTVEADADDAVTEDNEANNDRVSIVTVRTEQDDGEPETGPPNLVVTGLSAPDDVEPGDEITFLATIENTGGQRAGATDVRFLVEDEVLGEPRLDALAPGQSQSVTSDTWNATAGEHAITAVADVRDDVDESDEEDNERIKRIQVGDVDDGDGDGDDEGIQLGAISVEDPRAGEPVRPSVHVTNHGDEARDVTVTFYIDGTRLGEGTREDLGPGEEDTVQGPIWEPTRGEHTITAQTDDDQTEALVEVAAAEDPADAPVLPVALMLASLLAASLVGRRR